MHCEPLRSLLSITLPRFGGLLLCAILHGVLDSTVKNFNSLTGRRVKDMMTRNNHSSLRSTRKKSSIICKGKAQKSAQTTMGCNLYVAPHPISPLCHNRTKVTNLKIEPTIRNETPLYHTSVLATSRTAFSYYSLHQPPNLSRSICARAQTDFYS